MRLSRSHLRRILRETFADISGEDLQPYDEPPAIDLETLGGELSQINSNISIAIGYYTEREISLHDMLRAIDDANNDLAKITDSVYGMAN